MVFELTNKQKRASSPPPSHVHALELKVDRCYAKICRAESLDVRATQSTHALTPPPPAAILLVWNMWFVVFGAQPVSRFLLLVFCCQSLCCPRQMFPWRIGGRQPVDQVGFIWIWIDWNCTERVQDYTFKTRETAARRQETNSTPRFNCVSERVNDGAAWSHERMNSFTKTWKMAESSQQTWCY